MPKPGRGACAATSFNASNNGDKNKSRAENKRGLFDYRFYDTSYDEPWGELGDTICVSFDPVCAFIINGV